MSDYNEPLGMPKGSVRAIVTILIVILVGALLIINSVYGGVKIPEWLIAVFSMVIAFYFAKRPA